MKVGINEVKDILLGETPIVKVYRGEDVIWERGGLPSGYTRVEYLESTGTQYILTPFRATIESAIDIQYQWVGDESQQPGGNNAAIAHYGQTYMAYSAFLILKSRCVYSARFVNIEYNNDIKHIFMDKNQVISDDHVISSQIVNRYDEPTSTEHGLVLFAGKNLRNNVIWYSNSRIYNCRLYDNGELLYNFIPCLDENNRPCMYDLVTKQPFYNQGTGEFLYA